jgi:low temperature requirement protein LtrA
VSTVNGGGTLRRRLCKKQTSARLLLFWWVWIYTSWVTNWLDPDKTQVRVMLFLLMLSGLVLSTSLPEAFAGAHR